MVDVFEITSPKYSYLRISLNLPIILEATAKHDDTDLSDTITWSSNKDGKLGTGRKLLPYLTEGIHIISATVHLAGIPTTKQISFVITHEDKPPVTIQSLLSGIWGLSLEFSHDLNQRAVGSSMEKKILEMFATYQTTKYTSDGEYTYRPSINIKQYFDNVLLTATKAIRNIGFVRNSHQSYLDSVNTKYQNKEKLYDSLASFTSLDKSGFAPKLFSFLGGGTVLSFLTDFGLKYYPKIDSTVINSLNSTIHSNITNSTITDQTNKELQILSNSLPVFPASEVAFFIFFGVLSLASFNIMSILLKDFKMKKFTKQLSKDQSNYFVKNYREDMKLVLFDFYTDLKSLTQKFFKYDYDENFDNIEGIEIDEEEFTILYEGTDESKFWLPFTIPVKYNLTFLEKLNAKPSTKDETYYRLNLTSPDNAELPQDNKVQYFIRYKILPNWPTPIDPSKSIRVGGTPTA